MLMAGREMATTPTVRESSWYIWSAVARRALSYLRQQPDVDRGRIGAFGISMGGTTIWSFALDPRLKAACAIYGCGWNRYYRHTPRYGVSAKLPAMTEDDRVSLAGMAPEGCAPFIKCPILFLNASNDNHGNMDRAYETLARLPANVERRQAFTPRFCHHIDADFDQDLFLWMDTWLKGGPALRFKILTTTGEAFKVSLHENYFWPGQKTWEASVTLAGQPGWQTITLAPSDFKAQEPGGVPVNFAHCETLQLTGPWKDRNIVFTDFQWVTQ